MRRYCQPWLKQLYALICVATLSASIMGARAATPDGDDANNETLIPEPTVYTSSHKGNFNGRSLSYKVHAGETYLRDEQGDPSAAVFSFDYLVSNDGKQRPVTFLWNGGPGSASLWLHMSGLGPKRVVVPSDAQHAGAAPYPLVDSEDSILDKTDLVFVDPVGTGYSRTIGNHEGKEFWGLREDAQAMARFIKRWLTRHGRWNSPKFLLGESFGTTRAAGVADLLENHHNITLNGIVFISQALDYAGSTPYVKDNLISHITYVPTMAATAYYHGRVDAGDASLEEWVQKAREFATDELLPALFKGNRLASGERAHLRDELATLTGVTPDYIEQADLRVQGHRFAKELLRDRGEIVGLLDARYLSDPADDLTATTAYDAASKAISGAFTAGLMAYMSEDLGVTWERDYLVPADPDLSEQWNWNPRGRDAAWEPHYVNTAHELNSALEANPGLRVLVASAYYDLVTPFFDAEFTLNRHGIGRERVDYRYYEGGHMMYVNQAASEALHRDIRAFMDAQLAPPSD